MSTQASNQASPHAGTGSSFGQWPSPKNDKLAIKFIAFLSSKNTQINKNNQNWKNQLWMIGVVAITLYGLNL